MTKNEIIAELMAEYPTLRTGNEEEGYQELNAKEYAATIEAWADAKLSSETKMATKAAEKAALLEKLGITEDEAKLLLG